MLFEGLRCIAWGPKEMWVLLMRNHCGTGTWLVNSRDWTVGLEWLCTAGSGSQQLGWRLLKRCSKSQMSFVPLVLLTALHPPGQSAWRALNTLLCPERGWSLFQDHFVLRGKCEFEKTASHWHCSSFSRIWLRQKDIPSTSQYFRHLWNEKVWLSRSQRTNLPQQFIVMVDHRQWCERKVEKKDQTLVFKWSQSSCLQTTEEDAGALQKEASLILMSYDK